MVCWLLFTVLAFICVFGAVRQWFIMMGCCWGCVNACEG